MDTRWLKGIPAEEKEQRKKDILSRKNFLDEVIEILEEQFEESVPDYESPSWAYHQADHNGANRKLRDVIKFLKV